MTNDKVLKILDIIQMAHDGCGYCAYNLTKRFIDAFPEQREVVNEYWAKAFGHTFGD